MYEELLKDIFACSNPKYTSYQFGEMINVGLVLIGIKPSAIVNLDKCSIIKLNNNGFYTQPYPLLKKLTIVSKSKIHLKEKLTHKDVGIMLGYLTPVDIVNNNNQKNKISISIQVTFNRNNNKPIIAKNIMHQIVINKTLTQVKNYLQPFIDNIHMLSSSIPSEFKILSIEPIITLL